MQLVGGCARCNDRSAGRFGGVRTCAIGTATDDAAVTKKTASINVGCGSINVGCGSDDATGRSGFGLWAPWTVRAHAAGTQQLGSHLGG